MFETSVVREQTQAAEKRIGLLTASVAVHSIVILAAIILSIAVIRFPPNAPNQMTKFFEPMKIVIPPALGVHHATPAPAQHPAAAQHQATAPATPTAPLTVPNSIPTVPPAGPATTGPGINSNDIPEGDPNGQPGGIGDKPATATTTVVPDSGPLQPVGDVKPALVLHRVLPPYPHMAQVIHLNGVVIVDCVIGRDGRIRDAHVIRSSNSVFEQPALDAVQQWTFKPGTLYGQPVDTYFELTVTFTIR